MDIKAEQVRGMLAASARPYNAEAKRAAIAYASGRRAAGAGFTAIGRELGLSPATVEAWLDATTLVPVEVLGNEPTTPRCGLVLVDTRRGLRLEGLTVDEAAHVLERLR